MIADYAYNKIVEVFDWGAVTRKLVVNLGKTLSTDNVPWNCFEVHVQRYDDRLNPALIEEGERKVTNMYVSDEKGNRADTGTHLTLELEVHPAISLGSQIHWTSIGTSWIDAKYTIRQIKDIRGDCGVLQGVVVTELNETIKPQLDLFTYGSERYVDPNEGEITLTYAAFEPELDDRGKRPLIVWLHGFGEGGTDPTFPIAAHKACHFASDEIQGYFGRAYILVPQTPGYWMEPGYNEAEAGHTPEGQYPFTSKYTKSLMNLIETYVQAKPNIDTNRIYLGGASMGGFMTVRMLLDYPDCFAAAFPVCPAMTASYLSESDVDILKRQNIWCVTSAADTTIPGPSFTIGMFEKIIQAGGQNVWLSYPARVIDLSGQYRADDGGLTRTMDILRGFTCSTMPSL